ncbi:DivIVA domain protein [Clostridium argentinense CDC 2741]|uniref:DivIVA domain protein n=1 Tax=Clostridium argentinense CDC 2741 TaxID=1418104 RepID=A0A0C1RA62_9CLOT|nr:DivIVA domain-containing protein [Clostridium argentinense]ARC85263.1 cell division protein DivIVA [Clostridium argentinense]KIE47336.1 DivIVA domain protein [Clostridium argentinense CDC 2741]NFF40879.1 DivIVA domain-containing protein [Clostridium argentinense]NFP51409.1 DivIVA domain-containing protein [Clostridium argentinense]NFP73447.1 DivIVA domain-containing protein [Clostridium argentinense]
MRLTSIDINNKEFKRSMRGYNLDEVDEFLEKVSEDYESIYKENATLKERISVFEDKLDHYSKIEATIQSTLLLAQNAAEQAKITAQNEGELIIRNANESAKKILDKAHDDVLQINDEFDKTKQEFLKFRTKFRNFMVSQLEMFESLEKDFDKNYNISNIIEENVEEKGLDNLRESDLDKENLNYDATELEEIKSFFANND